MPVEIRKWWLKRKSEEETKKAENKKGSDAPMPDGLKGPPKGLPPKRG